MASADPCRSPEDLRRQLALAATDAESMSLAAHLGACPACRGAAESLLGGDGVQGGAAAPGASGVTHPLVTAWIAARGRRLDDAGAPDAVSGEGVTLAAPPPSEAATIAFPSVPAAAPPAEQTRFAQYRIVKELGSGGMGVVYLAEDTQLERHVALKVLRPELAEVPVHARRFLHEARATAKIENDHIVTIYQVGEANGTPFLAMQLLQGESLESWLKRGQRPTPGQAARIAREIALGLAAAHSRGLIHRDIKPANLWLEAPRGRVKILDFGLARFKAGNPSLTTSGAVVGTPAYMAPEQGRAETVDHRADLFSLGVVLFRLCTGELPFRGGDPMSCMIAIAMDPPRVARDVNPDLPQELSDLIAELLEKDPARRPQSAADVAQRLTDIAATVRLKRSEVENAASSLSIQAAPPAPPPVRGRRRRLIVVGLVAGVLLGTAGVAWVKTDTGTLEIRTDESAGRVVVQRNGETVRTVDLPAAAVSLPSGRYTLDAEARPGEPPLELSTDKGSNEIDLRRGDTVVVSVRRGDVAAPTPPAPPAPPAETSTRVPEVGGTTAAPNVPHHSAEAPGGAAEPRYLAFSGDGKTLAVGYRGRLLTFDATDLRRVDSLSLRPGTPDYKGGVAQMALAPNGHTLAVHTQSGRLALWDLGARKERALVAPTVTCHALAFSNDGTRLAASDGKTVSVWNVETLKKTESLANLPGPVSALAFGPGYRKLAVGCATGELWLRDLNTHHHEDISPLPRGTEVLSLCYAAGGRRLAVGRAHDTKVMHVSPARELFTLRSQGGAVALSHDGRWVAMAEGRRPIVHDTATRRRYDLPIEHVEAIVHVALAPNGRSLATLGKDGAVKLWDITTLVDGLTALFDGHGMTGWKGDNCPADTFVVDDGRLVATGKAKGSLLTDEDYADFELRLDYRLRPGARSAILVRAVPSAAATAAFAIPLVDDEHFQSGSATGFPPEMRTGSVYNVLAPSVLNNNPVGAWNKVRLAVEGARVVVEMNDLRVLDHELTAADRARLPGVNRRTGRIGLESRDGRVEFRNVLVKRLTPAEKK